MVHHRQRLPLGLEAGDHLSRVQSRLDDLQSHAPLDRLLLLGHVDYAHPPFADYLQELVGANARAKALGWGLIRGETGVNCDCRCRHFQEAGRLGLG
jgi:hypothetical protein